MVLQYQFLRLGGNELRQVALRSAVRTELAIGSTPVGKAGRMPQANAQRQGTRSIIASCAATWWYSSTIPERVCDVLRID